jgi:hypothetical protein
MAKLSAHGKEVGRVVYTTSAKAYMSDGVILQNQGFGWKRYGTCRVSPAEAYAVALAKQEELYERNPAIKEYRKLLHSLAGLGKAWKLHAAVQLLGDDVDGIWSECCDGFGGNITADIEEIKELVMWYTLAFLKQQTA